MIYIANIILYSKIKGVEPKSFTVKADGIGEINHHLIKKKDGRREDMRLFQNMEQQQEKLGRLRLKE